MKTSKLKAKQVYLEPAAIRGWRPTRSAGRNRPKMEAALGEALKAAGWTVVRAHPVDSKKKHGFLDSQRAGIETFRKMDPTAPVIVAECVWQYSHHVLAGLFTHQGPILTVANWSGMWPGLVGMLNLNGSMTKAGIRYSTMWSEDFGQAKFRAGLAEFLETGVVTHDQSHVKDLALLKLPAADEALGRAAGRRFREEKAIMGVFDEGCMGMFNAIIPDELLHPTGLFKERLSQSALYAAMQKVSDAEARGVLDWLLAKGMKFNWGTDEATELTERQTLEQCKMYMAALRLADDFGCATIGIQYQQGLKDLAPASDLVEGLLNNIDRPPVWSADGKRELVCWRGAAALQRSGRVRGAGRAGDVSTVAGAGIRPETRCTTALGRAYQGKYVWVFVISGRFLRHIWWAAIGERAVNGSQRCISPWAAAR